MHEFECNMTVETQEAVDRSSSRDHHHSTVVGHIEKVIRKKKRCLRRSKRSFSMALQSLFVSCQNVFKGHGTVPSPSDVQTLCRILDGMKPEDVGLSSDLQFFKPNFPIKSKPRVTYTTIYKCQNFSLCIFFLPATAVIPLHNHPGMTVFSKLLLGTVHIKSYDLIEQPADSDGSSQSSASSLKLARLKANGVFTAPCDTSVLYPTTGGNIHQFTAITPCAILDVLGPPYSAEDGRDCTYYKDFPFAPLPNGDEPAAAGQAAAEDDGDALGWLEEIEAMPEESEMDGIEYLGPQIIDTSRH